MAEEYQSILEQNQASSSQPPPPTQVQSTNGAGKNTKKPTKIIIGLIAIITMVIIFGGGSQVHRNIDKWDLQAHLNSPLLQQEAIAIQQQQKNWANTLETAKATVKVAGERQASEGIPRILWLFNEKDSWTRYSFTHTMLKKNRIRYAQASNFTVIPIDLSNYSTYLSPSAVKHIEQTIRHAEGDVWRWQRLFAMLFLLKEKGGVAIGEPFLMLTQSLQWLFDVDQNPYVNLGKRAKPTQVVCFYDPRISSRLNWKVPDDHPINAPFKNIEPIPAITRHLLAAVKGATFITQLITELTKSLQNDNYFQSLAGIVPWYNTLYTKRVINDPYFALVGFKVLTTRWWLLKQTKQVEKQQLATLQYYGLSLINAFYGPMKFEKQMSLEKVFLSPINPVVKRVKYLAQLPENETIVYFGPFRYGLILPNFDDEIVFHIFRLAGHNWTPISRGSILHRCLFFEERLQNRVPDMKEKPFIKEDAPEWKGLTRKIWVIWDTGIKNSRFFNQICVENMRRKAAQSNFQLHIVDKSNVKEYMDEQTLSRIQNALRDAKVHVEEHSWADIMRVALIYRHGGLYLDASVVLTQNLNWLVNIARMRSQLVFNRFGQLPKVWITFHPWYGSPFDFKVDQYHNTKAMWHIMFQNNVFAAEPKSEMMHDWLQQILINLQRPYSETEAQLNKYRFGPYKITFPDNQYLLPMESLKLVVGRKQWELNQDVDAEWANAMHYYGCWTTSAYLNMQKYRKEMNLQNPQQQLNLAILEYSQEYADGIVGHAPGMFKVFGWELTEVQAYLDRNYNSHREWLHPRSLISTHLLYTKPEFTVNGTHTVVTYHN